MCNWMSSNPSTMSRWPHGHKHLHPLVADGLRGTNNPGTPPVVLMAPKLLEMPMASIPPGVSAALKHPRVANSPQEYQWPQINPLGQQPIPKGYI